MDRYFSTDKANIELTYDYCFSEDPNVFTIDAKRYSSKQFKTLEIEFNQTVTRRSVTITFQLPDAEYSLVGYATRSEMVGNCFYTGKADDVMLNLQTAIADNFTLNGMFKTELLSKNKLRIMPRTRTAIFDFNIYASEDNFTIRTVVPQTTWTDSISDTYDTNIKINVYDYYDTSTPLTTLTKFYQQDGSIEFSLMEALGALTAQKDIQFHRGGTNTEYLSAFVVDIIADHEGYDNIMLLSHQQMGAPIYTIKGRRKEPKEPTLEDYAIDMKFLTERRERNWNKQDGKMFDYVSFMSTQTGDYVVSYKYYDADDMLISSRNTTYSFATGVALHTVPVSIGEAPLDAHYVVVGLTYSKTATKASDEIRYNLIDDYTPRKILAFKNGLGGCETYSFCDNRNNESLDRKSTFSNIYTNNLTFNELNRARRTINAETTDTYTLRSGVMPYAEAERLTWDLGNSLFVSIYDDDTDSYCKPIVLTSLEMKFDSRNSNAIVELEYQYAY